jgi:phenylpropionate dioxygenase-like ring-hydroxylating dioxygenase large terminal subunit
MSSMPQQAPGSRFSTMDRPRVRVVQDVPGEGENGLFTQSWFAVALSNELAPGQLLGRDFLDGRIVLFRGENGRAVAVSAYCPHVGADLSVGTVVGNNVRCAFHHWQYDQEGHCVKTGVGDAPPRGASLFAFPTREKFGIVWVFNGEEPLFDFPEFPYPESELVMGHPYAPQQLNSDPWVFCANTPDRQHAVSVHKVKQIEGDLDDKYEWDDFGFKFSYDSTDQDNIPMQTTLMIRGTSIFYRSGRHGDFWRGSIVGFGLPRPGQLIMYSSNFVQPGPKALERLEFTNSVSRRTLDEDRDIINTVHYRPGFLTKADKSLAKFLRYVRGYPRAHPSATFIR